MIPSCWIDANVILRFLLRDNEEMYSRAAAVMRRAERREIRLNVLAITVAEVVWTLESYYELAKEDIADVVTMFLSSDGINVEGREELILALKDYASCNVDFIDAYLASYAKKAAIPAVCTFDKKHFSRLNIAVVAPESSL